MTPASPAVVVGAAMAALGAALPGALVVVTDASFDDDADAPPMSVFIGGGSPGVLLQAANAIARAGDGGDDAEGALSGHGFSISLAICFVFSRARRYDCPLPARTPCLRVHPALTSST